jgi:hypothetical protein
LYNTNNRRTAYFRATNPMIKEKPSSREDRQRDRQAVRWAEGLVSAATRVRQNSRSKLNWLLRFIDRHPSEYAKLSAAKAATVATEITVFPGFRNYPLQGASTGGTPSLSGEEIAAIASELQDGINRFARGLFWQIPFSGLERFSRNISRGPKGKGVVSLYLGDDRTRFFMAVGDLLMAEGHRLRACQWTDCGKLFVARKRQAYCSKLHSQNDRTERFFADRSKSDYRHKLYEKRVHRDKPGVKVARRIRAEKKTAGGE